MRWWTRWSRGYSTPCACPIRSVGDGAAASPGDRSLPERLAFISDVHANWEALQAVAPLLKGIPTYSLGDIVGYGASPNEAVEWVRMNCAGGVLGNHDQAVLTGETTWFNEAAARSIEWTRRVISPASIGYLSSLPDHLRLQREGVPILMVHGSPDDPLGEYVYPKTHRDLFERYLEDQFVDLLALGHTHQPFVAETAKGTVFNPGSVGQPRQGVSGAFFAIVTLDAGKAEVELLGASYDVEAAAARIYAAGLPRSNGDRLFDGY